MNVILYLSYMLPFERMRISHYHETTYALYLYFLRFSFRNRFKALKLYLEKEVLCFNMENWLVICTDDNFNQYLIGFNYYYYLSVYEFFHIIFSYQVSLVLVVAAAVVVVVVVVVEVLAVLVS
jgi:hypothetical protein